MNKVVLSEQYNELAELYEENRGIFDMSEILNGFWKKLNCEKGMLLDLGSGAGEPVAQFFLKKGWQVKGVDYSDKMVELAGKYTPEMNIVLSDMRDVEFNDSEFDAVTAVYSLFHLPVRDQEMMFRKVRKWLKPEGKFLFTYASREYTGRDEFSGYIEFMGQNLYYSHTTVDKLKSQLINSGFKENEYEYIELGGETFLWVTAST